MTTTDTKGPAWGRKLVFGAVALCLAAMLVASMAYRFDNPSIQKPMRQQQVAQAPEGMGGMAGSGMDMDAVREMLAALEQRIEADPADVEALMQAANIYIMRQDKGRAMDYLERAQQAAGGDPEALMQLSKLFFDLGEFERARQSVAAILEAQPENMFARFNMGVILKYRLNKPEEAEGYFRQVAEGDHEFEELRVEAKKELQ